MSHWKIARNGGMSWRQGFSRSTFQHGMDRQTGCGRGGQLSLSGFAKIRRTRLFQRTLAKAVPSRDERVNSGGLGRYRCVDGCLSVSNVPRGRKNIPSRRWMEPYTLPSCLAKHAWAKEAMGETGMQA